MTSTAPINVEFRQIVASLKKRWWLWLAPTILCTLLSSGYALVKPTEWQATQSLLVRDEAAGGASRQGRFDTSDEMKTAQETILQVTKNRSLLQEALVQAGPPADRANSAAWPTDREVDRLRKDISVAAPNGAEFGRTEVMQLSVLAPTPQRAIELTGAVCDRLESRLKSLRAAKADSVIAELVKAESLAQAELGEATSRLQAIEQQVGSDLGELRALNDSAAGDANLRAALNEIKNELRVATAKRDVALKQQEQILAAQSDPRNLVATPNSLLESQPALRRLKDGLIDAQLRKSQLSGGLSREHPKVQAALAAEKEVAEQLRLELATAASGIAAEIEIASQQIRTLEGQLADVTTRLDRLAALRADYSNLVSEVQRLNAIVEDTHKKLADARASSQSAHSASLLTRLENPQAGNSPVGPRRSMIAAGGLLGGLLCGLGLVFLTSPNVQARGRRWSDLLRGGRRASDAAPHARLEQLSSGRRTSDADQRRAADPPPERRAEEVAPTPATAPSFGRRSYDRSPQEATPAKADGPPALPAAAATAPARPENAPLNLAQSLGVLQNQQNQTTAPQTARPAN